MSILHFKFKPYLVFFIGDEYDPEFLKREIYPTDNEALNMMILPELLRNKTCFDQAIGHHSRTTPFHYDYNPRDGYIHIWTRTKDGSPVNAEYLAADLENIDPQEGGPDTWMCGDIDIVEKDVAKSFGYHEIHLVPEIDYVGYLIPEPGTDKYLEYQVDLSQLPEPDCGFSNMNVFPACLK